MPGTSFFCDDDDDDVFCRIANYGICMHYENCVFLRRDPGVIFAFTTASLGLN